MGELNLEREIVEALEALKGLALRVERVEKRQDDFDALLSSVQCLAVNQKNMEQDMGEMKSDIKTLIGKPGKRWESTVDKIAMTIIGAVVLYLMYKAGIST